MGPPGYERKLPKGQISRTRMSFTSRQMAFTRLPGKPVSAGSIVIGKPWGPLSWRVYGE